MMKELTRKEALELGYEQCMPKYNGDEEIALIEDLTEVEDIEWLSNDDHPIMLLDTVPDTDKSNEHECDWYPITEIRLIP